MTGWCAREARGISATRSLKSPFKIGDKVRPRPEWREDPNRVPTGRIVRIEPWGDVGAIHVEGERHAFAGYVLSATTRGG